jgi:transcription antitermination factor NusG
VANSYKVGQKVKVTRGHYKGRPGVIRTVEGGGNYCMVTLTDTPGPNDVSINNMTWDDMQKR